jgi:hypothetical protein
MELITRQTLARAVAARWRRQYPKVRSHSFADGRNVNDIGDRLEALGADPDPDTVDRIIGNSWTRVPSCDECGRDNLSAVVQLGEEPDYESSTANICPDCLTRALVLVAQVPAGLPA